MSLFRFSKFSKTPLDKAVDHALWLIREHKEPVGLAIHKAAEKYGFSTTEIARSMQARRTKKSKRPVT